MNLIKTKPLTLDQIDELSAMVAKYTRVGDVVALSGDLGAGKTTFVSRFTNHMRPEPEVSVSSPTYVIHHIYPANMPIHHIDLYRLENPQAVESLGFEEFLGQEGVAFIEWFEKFPKLWTGSTLHLEIKITDMQHREYSFSTSGKKLEHWEEMLVEVKKKWGK